MPSSADSRLDAIMRSGKPEFVVVYGRRRIGKTCLMDEPPAKGGSFAREHHRDSNPQGPRKLSDLRRADEAPP